MASGTISNPKPSEQEEYDSYKRHFESLLAIGITSIGIARPAENLPKTRGQ